MTRRRLRGDRRGLTLIELVLTLTIVAVAGSLVGGAFSSGLRAWRSGQRSGREELVARIVLERIATQLRAALAAPASLNQADAVAFEAGDDHFRFVTLAAAGQAPVQVFYGMESGGGAPRLVYREHPWPDKDFFSAGPPRREEALVEVRDFAVTLVKRVARSADEREEADAQPPSDWSPLDRALPASVTVAVAVGAADQQEPRRYQITVPIPTQRVP